MSKEFRAFWAGRLLLFITREEGGAVAIEFSVVLPLMILLLICGTDLGMGIYRNMQVQHAAQAGAQYAVVNSKFNSNAIAGIVQNATSFSNITAVPVPATYCGCADNNGIAPISCGSSCAGGKIYGTYVSVSAQASYTPILPYPLISSSFSLTGRADVRIQ